MRPWAKVIKIGSVEMDASIRQLISECFVTRSKTKKKIQFDRKDHATVRLLTHYYTCMYADVIKRIE